MLSSVILSLALAGVLPTTLGAKPPGPNPGDWNHLKKAVEGRLYPGIPFAEPCFSSYNGHPKVVDQAACAYVKQNFFNSHLNRSDAFGGYSATNYAMCMSTGDSCELDFSNPSNPLAFRPPQDCKQGSVPSYYIDVKNQKDIIAALNFVKAHKVPLAIKNTGHDYQGRSSAPGSLALWMHRLKGITYNPAFVAEGCPHTTTPQVAITYKAGQQFSEIFQFAAVYNLTIVGGSDESVGMAGGWNQGGGHSSLSNAHGMGADRVLQYKVITTDGVARTVNPCQNSDLFYALRGGGGGTFAIVLEATSIASPGEAYQVANINWPVSLDNARKIVEVFVDNATELALQGWGGYMTPGIGNLILTTPKLNAEEAKESVQALFDVTASIGGVSTLGEVASFNEWFNNYVQGSSGKQNAVGLPSALGSRLVPQSLHQTPEGRRSVVESLVHSFNVSAFSQIHFTSPYGFNGTDGSDTSVNPLWRSSLYQIVSSNRWSYNSTLADRQAAYAQVTNALQPIRDLTPGGAAYHNEADIHEPNHEFTFWNANYDKLLAIKKKYDPEHILDCWHCVGWTPSLPKYSCYI